jgi:hypothetical protein
MRCQRHNSLRLQQVTLSPPLWCARAACARVPTPLPRPPLGLRVRGIDARIVGRVARQHSTTPRQPLATPRMRNAKTQSGQPKSLGKSVGTNSLGQSRKVGIFCTVSNNPASLCVGRLCGSREGWGVGCCTRAVARGLPRALLRRASARVFLGSVRTEHTSDDIGRGELHSATQARKTVASNTVGKGEAHASPLIVCPPLEVRHHGRGREQAEEGSSGDQRSSARIITVRWQPDGIHVRCLNRPTRTNRNNTERRPLGRAGCELQMNDTLHTVDAMLHHINWHRLPHTYRLARAVVLSSH